MAKRKLRYSDWQANNPVSGIGSGRLPPNGYEDSIIDAPSTVANYEYLLGALRSKAPGQWSQNLLELANHFTTAAFLAINTLANQTSASTHKVFERTIETNESDIELPWTDLICRILDNPNDDDHWSDFAYQISQQLSLTGLALIWKPTYYSDQIPEELYVLPSSSCLPWPPSPIYPHGSYLVQPYYPYGPFSTIPSYQSAAGARIPAEQVIRIKNPHPILRYDGYAVLTAIRRQMDTVDAIDIARWNTQQKGVDTSLVVNFDPKVYNPNNQPDLNRLRVQMEAMYSGPTNAGRFLLTPIGTSMSKLSNSPNEMAWESGWDQLVKFVMAAYGCPAPIAGLSDASTYATLYASLKQFNLISLDPHLQRIQNKLNNSYVQPYFGSDLYLKLGSQKITDEDMDIKKFQLGLQGKSIKRNELRKFLELPADKTSVGDEYIGVEKITEHEKLDVNQNEEDRQDPDVERSRPHNPVATGPIKTFTHAYQTDRLAEILDRGKMNGHAKVLDTEAKEFLNRFNND